MPLSARNERFQILKKLIFAGNGIYYLYTKHCADDKSLLRKRRDFHGLYFSCRDCKKWNVSERTVRNYCAHDKIPGAFLTGKTWNIPDSAQKPMRQSAGEENRDLLTVLREEKKMELKVVFIIRYRWI